MSNFFKKLAGKTNQDTIDQSGGKRFKSIIYRPGKPDRADMGDDHMSYIGSFCIADDDLPEGFQIPEKSKWQRGFFMTQKGERIEGIVAPQAAMAFGPSRKSLLVTAGSDQYRFPEKDWDGARAKKKELIDDGMDPNQIYGPTGHNQYMIMIKDLEHLGPFVWSAKGYTGMKIEGHRKHFPTTGILPRISQTIVAAAQKAAKQAGSDNLIDARGFWAIIGGELDKNRKPVFFEGANGKQLPHVFALPNPGQPVDYQRFFVDDMEADEWPNFDTINGWYEEHEDWAKGWATLEAINSGGNGSNGNGSSNGSNGNDSGSTPEQQPTPEYTEDDLINEFGL